MRPVDLLSIIDLSSEEIEKLLRLVDIATLDTVCRILPRDIVELLSEHSVELEKRIAQTRANYKAVSLEEIGSAESTVLTALRQVLADREIGAEAKNPTKKSTRSME